VRERATAGWEKSRAASSEEGAGENDEHLRTRKEELVLPQITKGGGMKNDSQAWLLSKGKSAEQWGTRKK